MAPRSNTQTEANTLKNFMRSIIYDVLTQHKRRAENVLCAQMRAL